MLHIDKVLSTEVNILRIVQAEDVTCRECKIEAVNHHRDLVDALHIVKEVINSDVQLPEHIAAMIYRFKEDIRI